MQIPMELTEASRELLMRHFNESNCPLAVKDIEHACFPPTAG
jgi:hypothetical protein